MYSKNKWKQLVKKVNQTHDFKMQLDDFGFEPKYKERNMWLSAGRHITTDKGEMCLVTYHINKSNLVTLLENTFEELVDLDLE